ncbi:Yip1 family protein [Pseudomonas sp. NFR16]|uniref:Yip1 family protein n=1 Tax=Pseudomonas sp. NFR16 TaxID=1566248 RepID=UPI0008D6C2B6|nr:Yip1 family protein [Pseudomonas sp. NFR16]SEI53760.1 Protein of unknown function [Pseudomonas sp. NFR16]
MSAHFIDLFTHPGHAWRAIRDEETRHPRHYIAHLVLLALIPVVALFVGTTQVGWSLVGDEIVKLSPSSALQLCILFYGSILIGAVLMGAFIRWMSRSFDARPSLHQCIGFAGYTATPFFIAGLGALYPSRWLALAVLLLAAAYSTFLLFIGIPTLMRLKDEQQGYLYAACVWGVGLLLLVTALVSMILFWFNDLMPGYVR